MKYLQFALAAAIALTAAATQAQSTITYDWTETGSSFGDGAGTVTVDYNADRPDEEFSGSGYDFDVKGITGTFDSQTITGLGVGGGFFNFANGTETAPATPQSGDSAYFDLSFDAGGSTHTIQAGYFPGVHVYNAAADDGGGDAFTLSPVAAPEPTTLALAGLGLAGMIAARRRK